MGTFEQQHPQAVVSHEDINDTVVTVIFRVRKHETTQNTRKGNTFYCVLGSLSSCDHLDLEKSPSVGETNGTAAGSGHIGRSDSLQKHWIQISAKSDLLFSPYCVSTCVGAGSNLNLTTHLIPFFSFPFFPFRSAALAEGRQEETPQ